MQSLTECLQDFQNNTVVMEDRCKYNIHKTNGLPCYDNCYLTNAISYITIIITGQSISLMDVIFTPVFHNQCIILEILDALSQ